MREVATIVCFLFFQFSSLSQSSCLQIINENNHPVKYASVTVGNNKAYLIGDSSGNVCLRPLTRFQTGDTLFVSAVGHKNLRIIYNGENRISLETNPVILTEVVLVNGEGVEEVWGTTDKPGLFGFGGGIGFGFSGSIIGRMIFPEGNFVLAKIQSVSFYDRIGKELNVPVRLRIFQMGKDSLPDKDYLRDNIIIDTKGKGWLEIDLKEQNIYMPREGLIFALELFANDTDYFYERKEKTNSGKKVVDTLYGVRFGCERKNGFSTLVKFNAVTPWMIDRVLPIYAGNLVCRVKVKVWR